MSLFGAFVVFVIGFWLVFFAIVSSGVTTPADLEQTGLSHTGPGDPSAPIDPQILKKMAISAGGGLVLLILVWLARALGFFAWLAQINGL